MRRWLGFLSGLLAVLTVTVWLATGASRGFTKTSVAVQRTDEITGLSYPEYEPRFVLGVEGLALGLGVAAVLFGVSRCGRPRSRPASS